MPCRRAAENALQRYAGGERNRAHRRSQQVGHGERNRVLAALSATGWRRQDTAQHLGISRKVLWEKMRKYQIFDEEPETRETE